MQDVVLTGVVGIGRTILVQAVGLPGVEHADCAGLPAAGDGDVLCRNPRGIVPVAAVAEEHAAVVEFIFRLKQAVLPQGVQLRYGVVGKLFRDGLSRRIPVRVQHILVGVDLFHNGDLHPVIVNRYRLILNETAFLPLYRVIGNLLVFGHHVAWICRVWLLPNLYLRCNCVVRLIHYIGGELVGLVERPGELHRPAVQDVLVVGQAALGGGVRIHANIIGAGELALLGQEFPYRLEGAAHKGGVGQVGGLLDLLAVLIPHKPALPVLERIQLEQVAVVLGVVAVEVVNIVLIRVKQRDIIRGFVFA